MAMCILSPCLRDNREVTSQVKDTYIRIGFLPFGVCRKSLLDNEITQWWVMFLFACIELCLGSVFVLGFISIYFSVCYYVYLYLGWQFGYFVESLCFLAFIHLNLPVVLQYFCCCRSLTKSATEADKEKKVLSVLNLAADAEESENGDENGVGHGNPAYPQSNAYGTINEDLIDKENTHTSLSINE
jgi:hypothetical protein